MKHQPANSSCHWFEEELDKQELIIEDLILKNGNLARAIKQNDVTIHNLQLQVASLIKQYEEDVKKLNSLKLDTDLANGKIKYMKLWCELKCKRQVTQTQQTLKMLAEKQLELQQVSQALLSKRDACCSTSQELNFFQNQSSYLSGQITQLTEEKMKLEAENIGLYAELKWMANRAQGLDALRVELAQLQNNMLDAKQAN